jgi:hypothetical protein
MNVCGLSGRSTGVACLYQGGQSPIAREFRQLNAGAGHLFHPQIPFLSVLPATVADSFQHARDALFPGDATLVLDRRRLMANCWRARPPRDEPEWQDFLAACRRALADDAALVAWFEAEIAGRPWESTKQPALQESLRRYGGDYLYLDTRDFGVHDVLGAAELCEKLLGYRLHGVNARLETALEDEPASPLSELQEKEAIIRRLDEELKERARVINVFLGERAEMIRLHGAVTDTQERLITGLKAHVEELKARVEELESWRARWKRPLRRGVPHLVRKFIERLRPGPDRQAA